MAMNTARDGLRSPTAMPCTPCRTPYRTTLTVKNASSTICPIAPLVGTHLPNRSGTTAPAVASAMNTVPNTYRPGQRQAAEEPLVDRHRHHRDRAAEPHRRPGPVQQRGQRAGEAAERPPHPDVSAALLGDRGAEFGADQRRGDEEGDEQHHQPGERLAAADRDRADGVDHHHRGDEEEDRVQPAEHPPELLPLGSGYPEPS